MERVRGRRRGCRHRGFQRRRGGSGIIVELNVFPNGTFSGGAGGGFGQGNLTNVENIVGTQFGDAMTGDAAANSFSGGSGDDTLNGNTGNDSLSGGDGNDFLEGSAGNDSMTGGAGADRFVFRVTGSANADRVSDFASGVDKILLDGSSVAGMSNLGATGNFAAGDARFFAGSAAHDADDRVIYNGATGQLFYDGDGNGAGAVQLIATLQAGAPFPRPTSPWSPMTAASCIREVRATTRCPAPAATRHSSDTAAMTR
jgi:Ca2+-binding RTX toxin-like protein